MTSVASLADVNDVSELLCDRYRLPAELAVIPTAAPEGEPGFFAIDGKRGRHVAFGACAADTASTAETAVQLSRRELGEPLAFQPDAVVASLRNERYIDNALPDQHGWDPQALVRRAYYLVRPMLSTRVRRIAQRRALSDWTSLSHPNWPVDTTVEEIHRQSLAVAMQAAGVDRTPIVWYWPNDHRGAVIMTHDVEQAKGFAFAPELARIDQSFGFPSSFQIVPEVRYDIDGLRLDEIRAAGCEIGLHGLNHDGHLFASYSEFAERAPKIAHYAQRFEAQGFRSPVMYRNPEWISELDISYDMSFPNVGHLDPQRGGCCTVFPFFLGDVVELPTTATQDYSLFHVLGRYDLDLWIEQLDIIASEHGLASFIVHPDYILDDRGRGCYLELLALLSERAVRDNLWKPAPLELADWWKQRSRMKLEQRGDEWFVAGEGSENASVAWATLDRTEVTITPPGTA
ncbi:MAG: hypothetical protein V3V01_06460 [Acidimicrobiales bacterium]